MEEIIEKFRLNGPQYYGGEMPIWREDMVNEESFYPRGRLKDWYVEDGVMVFVTQEIAGYMDVVNFKRELRRWLDYINHKEKIRIKIYDRSLLGDTIFEEI